MKIKKYSPKDNVIYVYTDKKSLEMGVNTIS